MTKENLSLILSIGALFLITILIILSTLLISRISNIENYLMSLENAGTDIIVEENSAEIENGTGDRNELSASMLRSGTNIFAKADLSADQLDSVNSYTEEVGDKLRYVNDLFSFSLDFPESWGSLFEIYNDGSYDFPIASVETVTIRSFDENIKRVMVIIIDEEEVPLLDGYPATEMGTYNGRVYLITTGADFAGRPGMEDEFYMNYADEVGRIIRPSFRLGEFR